MVDSYYLSKNLEVSTLKDFFLTMELHKSRIVVLKETSTSNHNIALRAEPKETKSDSSMDGVEQAFW